MGLVLNEAISTDLGATTQGYVYIREYHISKSEVLTLVVRLHTSKTSSVSNVNKFARHRNVPQKVKIDLSDSNITDTDIYTFSYGKLKEYLSEYFDNISDDWDELDLERTQEEG
tara:strand:+ start:929 stop:1270 length:342 start_codon:yes stop_codon:yes gene_type:complete